MTDLERRVRRLLTSPLHLAPIDAVMGLLLAVIALSVLTGPVLGQSPAGTDGAAASIAITTAAPTAAPASAPAATPTAVATQAPAATLAAGSSVAQATAAAGSPLASGAAAATGTPTGSPAAGASPAAAGSPEPSASAAPCPLPNPTPTPPAPGATPRPHNLCPAVPSASDPLSLIAWIFTPIFQALFMALLVLYNLTGDIGLAIIGLTLLIRLLLVPVFRAQIVSQRRMQMLQPELKAIQAKYKGNRAKISEEQMKLYKDRGVNPASGCVPALLQMVLLLPMYQVFSQGLSAPNISSMLQVFGHQVITVTCQAPGNPNLPCINTAIPWLAWIPQVTSAGFLFPGYPGGLLANKPEIFIMVLPGLFGLSLLALVSAILQLVQTRMMATPSNDPSASSQQRIFLILPLFSLIYGWFLPAGLFIYWITTTIFSIVQQYLINGFGGLFPLFGWTPGFAVDHKPRFPVKPLTPRPPTSGSELGAGGTPSASTRRSTTDSAAGTIKPARGRTSRRGRRR